MVSLLDHGPTDEQGNVPPIGVLLGTLSLLFWGQRLIDKRVDNWLKSISILFRICLLG
jgi:hypothetical protein